MNKTIKLYPDPVIFIFIKAWQCVKHFLYLLLRLNNYWKRVKNMSATQPKTPPTSDNYYNNLVLEEKAKQRKDRLNNLKIFLERRKAFNKIEGPRVGDFLKLDNGNYTRFTYAWPDGQMQTGGTAGSQYYLASNHCDYSGSLNHGIDKNNIELISEVKQGMVWFFRDNSARADNGVNYYMNFRVFKIKDISKVNMRDL